MNHRLAIRAALAAGLIFVAAGHAALAQSGAANSAPASDAAGEVGSAISAVEQGLFLDEHLAKVKLPNTLRYSFDTRGSLKKADRYDMSLALAGDKGKTLVTFKLPNSEVPMSLGGDLHNPVVDYFLDRDVETMQQITGGKRNFFQRRIRMALAKLTAFETVRVDVGGRSVEARQVQFQPYVADPDRNRFEKLATKRYTFVLSKSTPGEVLSIQTVVPGPNNDFANPLLTETLRFEGAR